MSDEAFDYKLVFIDWIDSNLAIGGWEHLNNLEPLKPVLIKSVGFLLGETDAYKTIALSISQTMVFGRTTIPTCAIQRIKEVRLKKGEIREKPFAKR